MSNNRYEIGVKNPNPVYRAATRLLYVTTAKYGGDWNSMLHTHTCTELFYLVGGVGQFKIADRLLPVTADEMVIINPNVEHTEVSLNSNPMEYIVLGVEGLEFSTGEEENLGCSIVNFRGGREDVLFFLRSLLREIENKSQGYEAVCQALLDVVLIHLMRRVEFAPALPPAVSRSGKECAAVHRYLDSHFKENITLDQLAALAHVNKYYMVHAFSRAYGVSPINYLISRRIRESRVLLSDTDHSLSQISHMLGFSSPSYFSQSFRKLEGISPMEYRKQRQKTREF